MQLVPLEQLQAEFAAALLGAEPAPEFAATTCAPQWLVLYRRHVQTATERALGIAFPVVRVLVSDEFFAGLAHAYARAHSSTSGDLNRYGAQFATVIRAFEHAQAMPYLADVAELEWLVHRAHYAADAHALPRERLAGMLPQELLASRFFVHPACAWIGSDFPIATIWRAHSPESLDRDEWALVARPEWRVEVVASNAAEIAALAALRNGSAMDDAIGAAFAQDAKFDFARTFVRWLDLGLLVAAPAL